MVKAFAFSVILISTAVTFLIVAPAIETAYFPVVTVLSIDKTQPLSLVSTEVWASYHKLRSCEYVGITWYLYDEKTAAIQQVGMTLAPRDPNDTSDPTRPPGYIKAGPWTVSLPEAEIRGHSLVEVFHRCSILWISRSHFYP